MNNLPDREELRKRAMELLNEPPGFILTQEEYNIVVALAPTDTEEDEEKLDLFEASQISLKRKAGLMPTFSMEEANEILLGRQLDPESKAWMDMDSGLDEYPYEWGPQGEPECESLIYSELVGWIRGVPSLEESQALEIELMSHNFKPYMDERRWNHILDVLFSQPNLCYESKIQMIMGSGKPEWRKRRNESR